MIDKLSVQDQLERSNYALFHENANHSLLAALKAHFFGNSAAYVLHWIPEQAEDIYEVVVDEGHVVIVEIERGTGAVINQRVFSKVDYEARTHSKDRRRKLQAALHLFQSKK